MPRTAEQNQNMRDKRRAKLMAFALKSFAENGFFETSVDDITKPAKCSHGIFYRYFGSVETAFGAIIDEYLTGNEWELPTAKALEVGGINGLRVLTDYAEAVTKATFREQAIAKISVFYFDDEGLDEKAKKFYATHNLQSTLATLVKQGQEEGKVIAGDPKQIALAAFDMVRGALMRKPAPKGKTNTYASSDIMIGMLLKGPIEG